MNVAFYTQTLSLSVQTVDSLVYFIFPLVQYKQGTGFCQLGASLKPMKLS